jgi:oxygen-dependent protoporphyrinogen oxidase
MPELLGARVAVIGGGITGLAAAHRVRERCGPGSVTIIEGSSRLGGKIRTERVDGFVLEGGPDCFLASKPAARELCEQLGLGPHIIETNAALRRSFVKRADRLHPLPDGITGLVPSRLMPLVTTGILSLRGRARAALEPFMPRANGDGDESVASFVRRRFGKEAWEWLVEPLLSGIYAGDGNALSVQATFPQLRETERTYGSILRPMVSARFRTNGHGASAAPRGFVTLAGGVQELVDALAAKLAGERVLTGTRVESIARVADGYLLTLGDGSTIAAGSVMMAAPAHEAARLIAPLDEPLARDLGDIPFVSTATVSVAFSASDVPRPLPGFGYVSPRAEGGAIVACTWTSNKFPARVPAGMTLLRFFVGRAGSDVSAAATDDALTALVRDELRRVHGIVAEPRFMRITRWDRALPQYTLGHVERVARIMKGAAERLPRLVVAGASYKGVGIPDCITSGWTAAETIA